MISERPWTLRTADHRSLFVETKEGHCFDISDTFMEEAEHFVACVNAIHAAGIQPSDVAVFVEAVRSAKLAMQMYEEQRATPLIPGSIGARLVDAAAALLLENRKESHARSRSSHITGLAGNADAKLQAKGLAIPRVVAEHA